MIHLQSCNADFPFSPVFKTKQHQILFCMKTIRRIKKAELCDSFPTFIIKCVLLNAKIY